MSEGNGNEDEIGTSLKFPLPADEHVAVVESMDEIFGTNDVEYNVIDAWGKKVRVVSMSAEDFIEWNEASTDAAKKTSGIRLFLKCIVNAKGERIGTLKHMEQLKKKSVREIIKVVQVILKVNGLEVKPDKSTEVEQQKKD